MSLLNKLQTEGSSLTHLDGGNATQYYTGAYKQSKLHNNYSITGVPNYWTNPSPSMLDLGGLVPWYNYRDNAPEGGSSKF